MKISEAQKAALEEQIADEYASFERDKDKDSVEGAFARLMLIGNGAYQDKRMSVPLWFSGERDRNTKPEDMVLALAYHIGLELGQIVMSLGAEGLPKQLQMMMAGEILMQASNVVAGLLKGKIKAEGIGCMANGEVKFTTTEGIAKERS